MIVLLVTGAHDYTHQALRSTGNFDLRILSYQSAFRTPWLWRATYIFTDVDRLNFWELELAARLFRRLREMGMRVLNDPARVRQRFSLLRTLKDRGLNRFDVWRVEDTARPTRFPVFLRTESAHRGPLSDLLHDGDEVETAIESALTRGHPLRELILLEYCSQPIREGIFRKQAIYRVGDRMVPSLSVHESRWRAKEGELGVAGQELYDDEYEMVVTNRYQDVLRPAFETANIEYGRADFGMVGDRPQVYEINTNPAIKAGLSHPFPIRVEAEKLAFSRLVDAFESIDTPAGSHVRIRDGSLGRQKRKDLLMTRMRWTP